jgi:predicted RNA-binding Zn-ribbon protein involved in translation (DUF1610 family)
MRTTHAPKTLNGTVTDTAHVVEVVCANCGFDVNEAELTAATCPDCGKTLKLKQSVGIQVNPLPPAFGLAM